MTIRCAWTKASISEQKYHDEEWGAPLHNDRFLFEFLILEGAQAELSWSTILNKREGCRKIFDNFVAKKIACYTTKKINSLFVNPEIVRNKLKVNAIVTNTKAFLEIQIKYSSFDEYIWQFVDGSTIHNS